MYQAEDNTYCREFTETISKGGTTDSAHGTACWQPDGTWRAVAG
jgi:surface antigen